MHGRHTIYPFTIHHSRLSVVNLGDAKIGEFIRPLVAGVAVVAANPEPLDRMLARQLVESAPEVLVLDRLLVGGAPAAPLPGVYPLLDALLHVLRVGVQPHAGTGFERLERADNGGHLHPVVRRKRLTTEKFTGLATHLEQRTPPADARVALAGAVRVDFDHFRHESVNSEW